MVVLHWNFIMENAVLKLDERFAEWSFWVEVKKEQHLG